MAVAVSARIVDDFPPLGSLTLEEQETAACVAVLAALRGFPSSLVAVSLANERDMRRARASIVSEPPNHVDYNVRADAQELLPLIADTALLRHFTERHESSCSRAGTLHTSLPDPPGLPLEQHHTSQCLQALAQAVRVFLDNTAMLLCKLESQCESHGMRLLELKRYIQPVADGVRVLTPIVRGVEDEGWGSTEVLDMLHAASTRPDVREAEGLIRFVLQATCAPYLHLLSSWMQEGRLDDDIHSEFFVSACTTASADVHTATTDAHAEPTNSTTPATGQGEWRGAEGWEGAKVEGQRFVVRCDAVPVLFQSVADDVLATGQLVHALREHGYLKQQIPSEEKAEQPRMQLGSLEESVGVRTQAVQQTMLDLTLNKSHLLGHLLTIRRVLLLSQADFLSDFMALASEELCKPASRASQARIDLSLGASLRSSTAANDPNCDRLSARLVPVDPPSPSTSSLQQQPLRSQPLQSQSPHLQRTPAQPPQSRLRQSRESMDGADLLSSLQAYEQYEHLLGDDADDDSFASHAAAAAAAGSGDGSGGGGGGGGSGADGDGRQIYSNPLSLLPQVTPVRPVSPAAAVAAQAARRGGAERRGASGESGWEAIYIDYQAPWPVSAVVPPSALQAYNRLFRFLLAARRTHLHLALAWSALQLTRGLKVEGTMLQRVHWLRHRMACAVTAILDHVAYAVISPNFDLMTSRLTKATSFHQLVQEHQSFLDTCLSEGLLDSCPHIREKLSSLLSISLRFATSVSTTIHTASSLPGLDSSSSAAGGGGWGGGGGRGGYGVEGRTSGGELADYAYGDATSDAKGRAARAAFRRQLAAEELQRGLEEEGFVEEMRSTHTAFAASLRAATAAIASALRDHPVLLSLHLALTAVAKGLP
ncbi:unnamed protein product [Closterium sp. Yama58-4]|nr:unnamed protein product [Closterium sp. Yama58-4]